MARKQKGSAKPQSSNGRAKASSSLERWNTIDDIPETEQDTFHRQQDKISLGDTSTGRMAADEDDEYGALSYGRSVLDVADEEPESEDEDEGDYDEDDESEGEESEVEESSRLGKSKTSAAATRKAAFEVDDDDDDDDDDEDDEEEEEDEDRDARVGGWGPNKQSYYSTNNLDDLSSDSEMDEDERREMEIREVKRLQTKSRQGVIDEDFGLGQDTLKVEGSSQAREARRKEFETSAKEASSSSSSVALDIKSVGPVQRAELMMKMQKASPETLALIGEYADIVEDIEVVSNRMRSIVKAGDEPQMAGLCCLHHQLLLTYAANLSFYFYLRASPKYAQDPSKLATHAVIGRLWKLKNGLQLLDNFGFNADSEEEEDEEDDEEEIDKMEDLDGDQVVLIDEDEENRDPRTSFLFKPSGPGRIYDDDDEDSVSLGSLEDDELMQLDREERESEHLTERLAKPAAKADKQEKQKKKEKKNKKQAKQTEKDVAPLAKVAEEIDAEDDSFGSLKQHKKSNAKRVRASTDAEAYNAFGEPTELNTSDSADKEAKKRSLKFYTGQIDAKDARKAGGSGLGGDSDIPYRDRERSRMAVANANARKDASLGGSAAGDRRLDGDDWGEEDSRDWRDVMEVEHGSNKKGSKGGDGDDGDDYYDLVASGKRSNKKAKKEEYDEARAAQRVAPMEEMEDGEHRGISRKIEKNRGLTPYRPKENRNPRVKKRKRYEAAQKKLSSRGPVYKGGQGALQGGYEGEKSGINSHVVKSRSFA